MQRHCGGLPKVSCCERGGGKATLSAAFEEGAVDVDSFGAFVRGEREFGGLSDERVHGG